MRIEEAFRPKIRRCADFLDSAFKGRKAKTPRDRILRILKKTFVQAEIRFRKAAEDHFIEEGRINRLFADRADCDLRSRLLWIAVNTGADARKGDGADAEILCNGDASLVAGGQKGGLVVDSASPDRPHGVDDEFRGQKVAFGRLGVAGFTSAEESAFEEEIRPGRSMNRTVHAASAEETRIRGVDNCVDTKRSDVAADRTKNRLFHRLPPFALIFMSPSNVAANGPKRAPKFASWSSAWNNLFMTIDATIEWKKVDTLADETAKQFGEAPDVMLVLGSGLGRVADKLADKVSIPVSAFADFPHSTVEGHAGMLHQGKVGEKTVLVQQGRVHLYEGYTPAEVVRSVRAAIVRGASTVVLTNAAGGIDPNFRRGSLMLIDDHINFTGSSPLLGPNLDERGQRFPDMSSAYNPDLRAKFRVASAKLGIELMNGVYAGMLGPTYETPAEVRMLKILGAKAVGMSTVHEVIAARHLGADVAGISCITNLAAGLSQTLLSHDEVGETGDRAASDLATLLLSFLEDLP